MPYREQDSASRRTIPYGRFPIRARDILYAVFLISAGAFLLVGTFRTDTLRCVRSGATVDCTESRAYLGWVTEETSLPDVRLEEVAFVTRSRNLAHTTIQDGSDKVAVLSGDGRGAREQHERLVAFLAPSATSPAFEGSSSSFSMGSLVWTLAYALGGLLVGAFGLWFAFRRSGRFEVEIGPGELVVTRTLAMFTDRRELPLEGVVEVEVQCGRERDLFRLPYDVGQVVLVHDDGTTEPLTKARLAGGPVHEEVARRLRRELGLEPSATDK